MNPNRHLWTFVLGCVLVLGSVPARAQGQSPRPLVTSTFGNWSISATEDLGLQISNRHNPRTVRLKMTHGSNGWFWLETSVGQYIMWSSGSFSRQRFSFDENKPDANAPALAQGVYAFGDWIIHATRDELSIEHAGNPHRVVLPGNSRGSVEVRGIQTRGDLSVSPDDALLVDGP